MERLIELHSDRLGQWPLPTYQKPLEPLCVEHIKPQIVKQAKITLLWKYWHSAYPDAKWVIVRRDKESLLDSLHRTPFMKAFTRRSEWEPWVDHHLDRIDEIKRNCDFREVWPKKFKQDSTEMRECVEWCGYNWSEQAARLRLREGLLK